MVIILAKLGPMEIRKMECWLETTNFVSMKNYFINYCEIFVGWYALYSGVEIITVIIGFKKDNDLMAAWVACINIITLLWCIGAGISNKARTDLAIQIGAGRLLIAKKLVLIFSLLSQFLAIVLAILILVFVEQIANMLIKTDSVLEIIRPMILMASGLCLVIVVLPTLASIMRCIDKQNMLT